VYWDGMPGKDEQEIVCYKPSIPAVVSRVSLWNASIAFFRLALKKSKTGRPYAENMDTSESSIGMKLKPGYFSHNRDLFPHFSGNKI